MNILPWQFLQYPVALINFHKMPQTQIYLSQVFYQAILRLCWTPRHKCYIYIQTLGSRILDVLRVEQMNKMWIFYFLASDACPEGISRKGIDICMRHKDVKDLTWNFFIRVSLVIGRLKEATILISSPNSTRPLLFRS